MFQPHTRRRRSKFLLLKIRSIQTFQYPCLWVDDVSFGATNFAYFSKGHDLTAFSLNMLFFAFKIQPKVLVVFVVVSRAVWAAVWHHKRVSPSKFWRASDFPPKQDRRFANQTPLPTAPGIRTLPEQLIICWEIMYMYWAWKRFRKPEWVRVVTFAKHQGRVVQS